MMHLFIQLVLLEIGLMRVVFLCLTGPYSPDLNPVERDWAELKERLYMRSPDF